MALKKTENYDDPAGENTEAYKARVKAGEGDPHPYDRLMILYRKEKNYRDELAVIKKAIAVFEKIIADRRPALLKKKSAKSTALQSLSRKIAMQTGLIDKKGKELYTPEPIARWKKRQETVEKKLKK